MDKITGLMELLGEDNNKKIKDKVAQFIIDALEDDIDAHLYGVGKYDRAEGNSRLEYYAQLNLLDRIIRHIKQG